MPSIKVLAIDGGGIRGIIPAMILAEIQTRLGMDLLKLDLIAGTSPAVSRPCIGAGSKGDGPYLPVKALRSIPKWARNLPENILTPERQVSAQIFSRCPGICARAILRRRGI